MAALSPRSWLIGLLMSLCAILAAVWIFLDRWQESVFTELQPSPEKAVVVTEGNRTPGAVAADLPTQVGDYERVVERPLFNSSRRPIAPEDTPVAAAPPKPPPTNLSVARLTSTILTPKGQFAWFLLKTSGETLRLTPGDDLLGWTLKTVDEDHVILTAGGTGHRLDLRPEQAEAPRPKPMARIPRRRSSIPKSP